MHANHRNASVLENTPRNAPPVSSSPTKSAIVVRPDEQVANSLQLPREQVLREGLHLARSSPPLAPSRPRPLPRAASQRPRARARARERKKAFGV